jgi:hypothetical protein
MFGAHETQIHLTHWGRTLPLGVDTPDRHVTRHDLVTLIRFELLPFITYGPSYERAVADNLRRALDMFARDGRGDEFAYWIAETVTAANRARQLEAYDPDARSVLATHWSVSYEVTDGGPAAVLRVHFPEQDRGVAKHPVHYGKEFPSLQAAREYAWNVGVTQRFVSRFAATASA